MSSKDNLIDRITDKLNPSLEDLIFIDEVQPRPFTPKEIKQIADILTYGINDSKVKAYSIYRWITDNIRYDEKSNQKIENKSAILYALKHREGTCYSMSRVYIALAKSVGLDARLAKVIVDEYGEKVPPPGHVCALVYFNDKDYLLFDPAYEDGDAKHQEIEIYSREDTNRELIEDILMPYVEAMKRSIEKKDFLKTYRIGRSILPFVEDEGYNKYVRSLIAYSLNAAGIRLVDKYKPEDSLICFQEADKYYHMEEIKQNIEITRELMGKPKIESIFDILR
jgi:hypothetical protein